jgi:hypothetical protein
LSKIPIPLWKSLKRIHHRPYSKRWPSFCDPRMLKLYAHISTARSLLQGDSKLELTDIEFLRTFSILQFSSRFEDSRFCDFVVLTHRFVMDLQFPIFLPRNVHPFSFKAFPPIVQQAIIESISVDFLFLREYWNYFTQSDWCLLMTDFVRVLQ